MGKATELSTVTFELENIDNAAGVDSKLLSAPPGKREHQMGTADTPVDVYIERLLRRMLMGEHSQCYIERKSTDHPVAFTIRLKKIHSRQHLHQLPTDKVFELAKRYKETGVKMFKK